MQSNVAQAADDLGYHGRGAGVITMREASCLSRPWEKVAVTTETCSGISHTWDPSDLID